MSGDVVTLDPAVADAARDRPCQERVAARAVPAAALLLGATVLGVVAFLVELLVVRPRRRAVLRAPGVPYPPAPGTSGDELAGGPTPSHPDGREPAPPAT